MSPSPQKKPWPEKGMQALEVWMSGLVLMIWLLVVILVALRYLFNSSIPGANEWIVILFVYATSLGAALGIGRGGHLAIGFAVEKTSVRVQSRIHLLRKVLMGCLHLAIILLSVHWISTTGHFLMPSTGLPRWVAQASIPLGGLLGLVLSLCSLQQAWTSSTPVAASEKGGDGVS